MRDAHVRVCISIQAYGIGKAANENRAGTGAPGETNTHENTVDAVGTSGPSEHCNIADAQTVAVTDRIRTVCTPQHLRSLEATQAVWI